MNKENLNESATKGDLLTLKSELTEKIDEVKSELTGEINSVKTNVSGLKKDVRELKTDVSGLKQDVKILKTDVIGLKKDVRELRTDVRGLKVDVRAIKDHAHEFEWNVNKRFDELNKNLKDWKDEILKSNDKVVQLLVRDQDEHAALGLNYTFLEKRVTSLEKVTTQPTHP